MSSRDSAVHLQGSSYGTDAKNSRVTPPPAFTNAAQRSLIGLFVRIPDAFESQAALLALGERFCTTERRAASLAASIVLQPSVREGTTPTVPGLPLV
jgi:hypothetical protein